MSARRPPSAPPEIPGFSYVELLGSGGFADVFLYEQRMPRRRVAIKVLLAEALTEGAHESFDAEANLMAQLSTHPSIVTIYQADIAGDGRPYLAMEYCPKPNLGARYRREKISVAEALRIGVQVAGAVETSHRAGILHRDIKPANILVTEYNRPALTDFGISVALVGGGEQESVGMSIPWSPPEVFGASPQSGTAADIYSLGATVYTILAGRSPFEVPGGANSGLDLIARIQSSPLTTTGRADVPPSLEEVLATAMAKREDARYGSALEFARALQKVQLELAMSVTPADVLDDQLPTDDFEEEDDGNTRIRGIVTIDPTAPVTGRRGTPRAPASTAPATPTGRPPAAYSPAPTRAPAPPAPAGGVAGSRASGAGAPPAPGAFGAPAAPAEERTQLRNRAPGGVRPGPVPGSISVPVGDDLDETLHRAPTAPGADAPATEHRRSKLPYIIGSIALVLLIGVGALVFVLNGGAGSPAEQATQETDSPVDNVQIDNATVPAPTGLAATTSAAGVVFTWTNPDPQPGDSYRWSRTIAGQPEQAQRVEQPTITLPADAEADVCIQVYLVRADGRGSDPAATCAP
ncbi:serine/threonine-protein kinase [Herbiconiux sp. P18]|uniref:serine/threonine-protein kinase n=1 Tax=Herbiconiux liangxiaofengii TaxID=3342795 RepID=UPI0035BAC4BE